MNKDESDLKSSNDFIWGNSWEVVFSDESHFLWVFQINGYSKKWRKNLKHLQRTSVLFVTCDFIPFRGLLLNDGQKAELALSKLWEVSAWVGSPYFLFLFSPSSRCWSFYSSLKRKCPTYWSIPLGLSLQQNWVIQRDLLVTHMCK